MAAAGEGSGASKGVALTFLCFSYSILISRFGMAFAINRSSAFSVEGNQNEVDATSTMVHTQKVGEREREREADRTKPPDKAPGKSPVVDTVGKERASTIGWCACRRASDLARQTASSLDQERERARESEKGRGGGGERASAREKRERIARAKGSELCVGGGEISDATYLTRLPD